MDNAVVRLADLMEQLRDLEKRGMRYISFFVLDAYEDDGEQVPPQLSITGYKPGDPLAIECDPVEFVSADEFDSNSFDTFGNI